MSKSKSRRLHGESNGFSVNLVVAVMILTMFSTICVETFSDGPIVVFLTSCSWGEEQFSAVMPYYISWEDLWVVGYKIFS